MRKELLSVTKIDRAKPSDPSKKSFTINDGSGLRINVDIATNRKAWEFFYNSPTHHKRRKTSFGTYPTGGKTEHKEQSINEARKQAQEFRDLIAQGIDPLDHREKEKKAKEVQTKGMFYSVIDEWLHKKQDEVMPTTYKKLFGLFDNFVKRNFQNKHIEEIQHYEIIPLIELKLKTAPETANRLLWYLSDVWQFAQTRGYAEINVISKIRKKDVLPKSVLKSEDNNYPKILKPKILGQLYRAIEGYNGQIETRNSLRLVYHLPLRASNLVSLKWAFIDFENALLTIPRAEMKRKTGEDFKLPLTSKVIQILREQQAHTGHRVYVFATSTSDHLNSETPNGALAKMSFNDASTGRRQRLHSFRGTFRALALQHHREHGETEQALEAILDHQERSRIVRAYSTGADLTEAMRNVLEWWDSFLEGVKNGKN